jgi:Flp pilus assembly secretin CpaC
VLEAAANYLERLGRADLAQQVRECAVHVDKQKRLAEKTAQLETLRKEIDDLRSELADPRQILLRLRVIECVLDAEHPSVERLLESINGAAATTRQALQFCVLDPERQAAANVVLRQLQESGTLKMLAEPTMVTLDGQAAHMHCGGEFPVPANDANEQPQRFEKFGTLLDALPVIQPDGTIRLDIRLSVREVDMKQGVRIGGQTVPAVRSRNFATGVAVPSGHTLVLAGAMQRAEVSQASPTPNPSQLAGTPATALLVTVFAEVVQPPLQAAKFAPAR